MAEEERTFIVAPSMGPLLAPPLRGEPPVAWINDCSGRGGRPGGRRKPMNETRGLQMRTLSSVADERVVVMMVKKQGKESPGHVSLCICVYKMMHTVISCVLKSLIDGLST
jgi:hypothetical protein